METPKKNPVRLKDRTQREREGARRVLHDRPSPHNQKYDPDVHPAGIVAFFQERLDQVEDAQLDRPEKGPAKYLVKPVRIPTLAAYAVSIKINPHTLHSWAARFQEFEDALAQAQAIQHQILIEVGIIGGLNASMAALAMKNYHGWADKVEQDVNHAVTLKFDKQDEDA